MPQTAPSQNGGSFPQPRGTLCSWGAFPGGGWFLKRTWKPRLNAFQRVVCPCFPEFSKLFLFEQDINRHIRTLKRVVCGSTDAAWSSGPARCLLSQEPSVAIASPTTKTWGQRQSKTYQNPFHPCLDRIKGRDDQTPANKMVKNIPHSTHTHTHTIYKRHSWPSIYLHSLPSLPDFHR